jgi:hypothetical protein
MANFRKDEMKYYYHRSYFSEDAKDDYIMHITANGVSLQYRDGRVLRTTIIPELFFPGQGKLTPKDINNLHRFIKFNDFKIGELFDKESFDKMRNQYLKEKLK